MTVCWRVFVYNLHNKGFAAKMLRTCSISIEFSMLLGFRVLTPSFLRIVHISCVCNIM